MIILRGIAPIGAGRYEVMVERDGKAHPYVWEVESSRMVGYTMQVVKPPRDAQIDLGVPELDHINAVTLAVHRKESVVFPVDVTRRAVHRGKDVIAVRAIVPLGEGRYEVTLDRDGVAHAYIWLITPPDSLGIQVTKLPHQAELDLYDLCPPGGGALFIPELAQINKVVWAVHSGEPVTLPVDVTRKPAAP